MKYYCLVGHTEKPSERECKLCKFQTTVACMATCVGTVMLIVVV